MYSNIRVSLQEILDILDFALHMSFFPGSEDLQLCRLYLQVNACTSEVCLHTAPNGVFQGTNFSVEESVYTNA